MEELLLLLEGVDISEYILLRLGISDRVLSVCDELLDHLVAPDVELLVDSDLVGHLVTLHDDLEADGGEHQLVEHGGGGRQVVDLVGQQVLTDVEQQECLGQSQQVALFDALVHILLPLLVLSVHAL